MNKNVLITGASSGIGMELAKVFAANGYNIILTSRSQKALTEVKKLLEETYGVTAWVFPKDLSYEGAVLQLYNEISEQGLCVDVLVNNAGFGSYGLFVSSDIEKQASMIDLNVRALTQATYYFGADMKKRKSGKILNIASIAAFMPGAYMSVYFATKAYVLSFSCALHEEMKEFGVTVTALCPCPTRTNFEAAAKLDDSTLFKKMKVESAEDMARAGYKALMKGKAVATFGAQSKLINFGSHFVSRKALASMSGGINGKPREIK